LNRVDPRRRETSFSTRVDAVKETSRDGFTICDLTQAYGPSSGGVRTYIDAKRSWLKRSTNWRHILIIPGERDEVESDGPLTTYMVRGPRVPKTEGYRFIFRLSRVRAILAAESPDVVELGSPYVLPWAAFGHRSQSRCAVVGYYHTDFPEAYAGNYSSRAVGKSIGGLAQKCAERYANLIYNRCDLTVTASDAFHRKLTDMGVLRTQIIPLGVDLEVFNPSRRDPELRRQLGVGRDEILLAYAGRLDSEKRVDVLADAVRMLSGRVPARLLMMGDGPYRSSMQEAGGDGKSIIVRPFLSDRMDLARHLASADIYVTAGPHETFGLSVVEAQACGLPVVGVRAGALIERVPQTVGLLGAPGSAGEMAQNISHLWENGLREVGEQALRHARENYSWERTFSELASFYETLHREISERALRGGPEQAPAKSQGVLTRYAGKLVNRIQRFGLPQ
jgi:alpha-1,6-mannosyltransferase